MSVTSSSVAQSTVLHSSAAHLHQMGDNCPYCDQPIPLDRYEETKERISLRDHERSSALEARLNDQYTAQKAIEIAQVRQESADQLATERAQLALQITTARTEERQLADAALTEKLAAQTRAHQDAQAQLETRTVEAERNAASLRTLLEDAATEKEAAVEAVKADAAAREESIRADANKAAEANVRDKMSAMELAHQQSISSVQEQLATASQALTTAEENRQALQSQIHQVRQDAAVQVENARLEATQVAQAGFHEQLTHAELAKTEAEAKAASVTEQMTSLQQSHEVNLNQRLTEQREALERDKQEAINKEKTTNYEDTLKWQSKVEDLQRALEKKTAEELGDLAEGELYDALLAEFEGDKIERIGKGQPGADIRQTVIHNGKECGKLLYDSKNHGAWRNEFVTKLVSDQIADGADHAILCTRKFPAGKSHLDQQDGVIITSPGRVVAVATVIRQHIVQCHTLRRSNEERSKKTEDLYAFIVSDQFKDMADRIDGHTEALLELQEKEMKAHQLTWRKQGELLKSMQKTKAQMIDKIETIIGIGEDEQPDSEEEERTDD